MAYRRIPTQDGVTVMNKELYDNLQDGIDELKSSQFLEMSGDKMIMCDSSKKGGLLFNKVYGKSKQMSTTGAQLLDLSSLTENVSFGITWTFKDGYVMVNGTATDYATKTILLHLEPGTYTLNGNSDANGKMLYRVQVTTSGGTEKTYYKTFSLDGTETRVVARFQVNTGVTVSNYKLYPMLNKGSEALPWETFTDGKASPSPEFPQPIESVGNDGSVEVEIYGGNLVDFEDYSLNQTPVFSIDEKNGVLTVSDSKSYSGVRFFVHGFKAGDTVNFSARMVSLSNLTAKTSTRVRLFMSDGTNQYHYLYAQDNRGKIMDITLKIPENVQRCAFEFFCNNTDTTLNTANTVVWDNIMVNIGETPLPYEPYKEPQSLISSTPNGLAGIPVTDPSLANYTDENGQMWCCDEIDYERGVYVQRVIKNVFDGSEDEKWYKSSTIPNCFYITSKELLALKEDDEYEMLSNCYKCTMVDKIADMPDKTIRHTVNVNLTPMLYIKDSSFETLEDIKAYYATNPFICLNILKEPIETPLSIEEISKIYSLKSHEGVTTIISDEDVHFSAKFPTTDVAGKLSLCLQEAFFNNIFTSTDRVLRDTKKGGLRFNKIFGKSEQATTNGAQLFNPNAITFSNNLSSYDVVDDGYKIIAKGKASNARIAFEMDELIGKSVTLKYDNAKWVTPSDSQTVARFRYVLDSETVKYVSLDTDGTNVMDVTFPENTTSVVFQIFANNSGTTLENDAEVEIYGLSVMLTENKHLPWESFTNGPTPNPYYPQEIKSVGGFGNLFDASRIPTASQGGATVTNNGDGSFTISGSGKLSTDFYSNYDCTHEESVKLFKSGVLKLLCEQTTCPYFYVRVVVDGEVVVGMTNSSSSSAEINLLQEWLDNESMYVRFTFAGTSGSTITPSTIKPMVYQNGDGTYLPYTNEKEIAIKVFGKNLVPESALDNMSTNGSAVDYDNVNHIITWKDSSTGNGKYCRPCKFIIGKPYTLSFDIRGTAGRIAQCGWNKSKDSITLTNNFVRYSKTFIATEEKEAIAFYSANNGGFKSGDFIQFTNVQIEEGNKATEYVPYSEQLLVIPRTLPAIPVTDPSLATYTDENEVMWCADEIDFERGKYVQRITKFIVNPNEITVTTNTTYDTPEGLYAYAISLTYYKALGIKGLPVLADSFYFADLSNISVANRKKDMMYTGVNTSSGYLVVIVVSDKSTLEEFKTSLQENPVTFQAVLAEPIETDLSVAEMEQFLSAETNDGITKIVTNSEVEPTISVSYGKSELVASTLLAENLSRKSISVGKVANNFTTTEAGFVADARLVKVLNDNLNVNPSPHYYNWKGLWCAVIELETFFIVILRGSLTEEITKQERYTLPTGITFEYDCLGVINFSLGKSGELVIDKNGVQLILAEETIPSGAWVFGQGFVYKMPV